MRFCELCDKEVINLCNCKCMGCVRDIEFDKDCGQITALIVPGPAKYFGFIGKEFDFFIPWCKVIRIGPDIIVVEIDEKDARCKK